jgi:hypothetical protein
MAPMMGTMTTPFQAAQIQRLVASQPAVKGLARDPEMTAGEGHILGLAVEIHPAQANPRRPTQFDPDRR